MTATYRAEGVRIDYTPDAAVTPGTIVVQGSLVGIATEDIAASVQGSLAIEGIFDFLKEETAMTVGQDVYYDEDTGLAYTPGASGIYLGKCVVAATATSTYVRVKLVIANADESGTGTGTGTGVA